MLTTIQAIWDQMRADLKTDTVPPFLKACEALISEELGPLTDLQTEDLKSIQRSFDKLVKRVEGEPIDWTDYSEAAHALRGPLNSTIGFSRLMLKGIEGPVTRGQQSALETIYNLSGQMLAIFNLLLDALLFYNEDMSFASEPVPANEVMDALIAIGQKMADNREFALETDLDPAVAVITLQSDPKRLKQSLSSLMAVSGAHIGDGRLTLRAWPSESGLSIEIVGQECQLPTPLPINLPSLLTDKADTSLPYSIHLRLGLASRLLIEMGGKLETRQTDRNCIFTVTLPIA